MVIFQDQSGEYFEKRGPAIKVKSWGAADKVEAAELNVQWSPVYCTINQFVIIHCQWTPNIHRGV